MRASTASRGRTTACSSPRGSRSIVAFWIAIATVFVSLAVVLVLRSGRQRDGSSSAGGSDGADGGYYHGGDDGGGDGGGD